MTRRTWTLGVALALSLCFALFAQAASATNFTAASYKAWPEGNQSVTNTFGTNGGFAECSTAFFDGLLPSASTEMGLHPAYSGTCKAFGITATIGTTGCGFQFHAGATTAANRYAATMDVICSGSSAITIVAGTCEVQIKAQTGLSGIEFENVAGGKLTIETTVPKLAYTVTKDGPLCPLKGTGANTDGTYAGITTIKALNDLKTATITIDVG